LPGEGPRAEYRWMMVLRILIRAIITGVLSFPALYAQSAAAKPWSAPHAADGHPDLQGLWTNNTLTPLERPKQLAGKPFFTEQEARDFEKQTIEQREAAPDVAADSVADPVVWWERGTKVVSTLRTSLIVDPPDGRIPPLTPEAQKRLAEARAETRRHPADGPEDRSLQERCILSASTGPPTLPAPYNNNIQIVQTPGVIVLTLEMIHDTRIIAMDGRPHLPPNVRLWLGDSVGHWEGDTLVVDTTNFTDRSRFRGSDENLHLIERFTRTAPDTILYQFTIDDPTAFTKSWTAEIPLHHSDGQMYEFACHEGNVGLAHMLINARVEEKRAAESKNNSQK